MRRTMLLAAVASLALTGAAAAATLEIATDQSPVGLDPHLATAFATVLVNSGVIYEGLTAVDKDLAIVPALAASWTISPMG
jgi:peptide/nickel transport system substrate-binding protein